jgi:hypothetical protein
VSDGAAINDQTTWQWGKSVTESLVLTDAAEMITGWNIEDVLTLQEAVVHTWSGTWLVESKLQIVGEAVLVQIFNETATSTLNLSDSTTLWHKMIVEVAESLNITEVLSTNMTYNPTIVESLAITAAVTILKTINENISESLVVTDSAGYGWIDDISESLGITDAATMRWLAIQVITESLELTEETLFNRNISASLTEVLELAATVAFKHIINVSVEDILHCGVVVELEGAVWECWVLNTNAFHASVYSGFSFNSYAVYNNVAYGCKSDGIYELSGDDDDGDEILSGIVLPETNFGTTHDKRFRKAYFGLSGGTTPSLRVETDTGSTTYTISSSKANIGRDMKGEKWVLKVQDFDSLDFIELCPVVLTR